MIFKIVNTIKELININGYKKFVFPSIIGIIALWIFGVNLKSVIPTESEASLMKVIGATSTTLRSIAKKDTTRNTVNIPI
jgi:hypothetical protein